ncbi:MAG: prepilin-type N-terminal cleavage/methylation domain-containing protein [Bacilli bacterium]|nr:prepilin-type N-terminal cleavage/methylation domain-containing protein [Bacilli bacterium]
MKKLNKKGFTLVELLAVIVILAILIVIVATTALPAMNNAKKNTFVLYAQRLQGKAQELYAVDANMAVGSKDYTVQELMGSGVTEYTGTLTVTYESNSTTQKYTVTVKDELKDVKNNQCIAADTEINSAITGSVVVNCSE